MLAASIRFLNSPQPPNMSYMWALRASVYTSLFVALFLVAFQPFGLGSINGPNKLLVIASYGLPCFPPNLLINCVLVHLFRRSGKMAAGWKVYHTLATMLLFLLVIGASNYTYDCILSGADFNLRWLVRMELYTALVGFFPAAVIFASARALSASRNESAAEALNRSIETAAKTEAPPATVPAHIISLSGDNKDESLSVDARDICYLKSDGNYVEVVVATEGAKRETKLLRATLKDMETQLAGQCGDIVRCHRSFLVNQRRILGAEGNAMGLVISLDRDGLQVPVSRSYVAAFRK